jgi:hypothetical protein
MVKAISALACVANERTIPIDLTGHSLPALGEVPQNSGVSFAVGRFHQAQTFFGLFQAVFWAHWVPDSSGISRTQRNQDGKVASKQLLPVFPEIAARTNRNLAIRIERPPKPTISDHAPASWNGWSERAKPGR